MSKIEFENVSKYYGKRPAVEGFSLTIEQCERLVILGPSGCGKTTVLRMLAGFVEPDTGNILIDGKLVSMNGQILKEPEERNIGMIFQNLSLWPHLSVKQNLEFGLKARGIAKNEREKRISEILKLFHIDDYINARPSQLSGGEQQRVALARGLVLNPKIMLMDEPLSSLNFELNIRLRNEIINIQEKTGFTLVYVTHNLEEAFNIAHRVVVMKNGEISLTGTSHEVKKYFETLIKSLEIK